VYIVESGNLQVSVNGERIRTLTCGTLFGELALLFDARRSATVTCLEDCKLWRLNRNAFKIIQRNATNLSIMQRSRRFQIVPELAVLPPSALSRLMATLTPMSYRSGDALYAAGKCSTKIMLIEEGTVVITVPSALQHLPQDEIERVIGIIRPNGSNTPFEPISDTPAHSPRGGDEERMGEGCAPIAPLIPSFTITEGCVIGMDLSNLRRTWRQNRSYETLFHTVIILSKHHH
jgi:CRP-like cAMP-binding protein